MELRLIRCGMLAGWAVLLALGVLGLMEAAGRPPVEGDDDFRAQAWDVLAEARRITEGAV